MREFLDPLAVDRLEGAGADAQLDPRGLDPAGGEGREQGAGEMQAGGGRGDRARAVGEHRLVALAVAGAVRAPDVGGQRHAPAALGQREHPAGAGLEGEGARAVVMARQHLGRAERGRARACVRGAEADPGPGAHPAAHQAAPALTPIRRRLRRLGVDQQDLERAAAGLGPGQARRDHARAVEHQEIAAAQPCGQVGDALVAQAVAAAGHQQARGVARLDRLLGDELRRHREVEERGQHAWSGLQRAGARQRPGRPQAMVASSAGRKEGSRTSARAKPALAAASSPRVRAAMAW